MVEQIREWYVPFVQLCRFWKSKARFDKLIHWDTARRRINKKSPDPVWAF
jgi:hypothetical protein